MNDIAKIIQKNMSQISSLPPDEKMEVLKLLEEYEQAKQREEAILNHTPLNRYGDSSELIGATIWLSSEASSFVTGSEVTIDGGFSCMTI